MHPLETRKPALRMADMSPDVLFALSTGKVETKNLVEWLSVDNKLLFKTALDELFLNSQSLSTTYEECTLGLKITKQLRRTGQFIYENFRQKAEWNKVLEHFSGHKSDMVRSWAAYALTADRQIPLNERFDLVLKFASDPHMAVRECAWDSIRIPYISENLENSIKLLKNWVLHENYAIRRCAIEATRPRGVWTSHINQLKSTPSLALPLLEAVRSDSERYVQNAVGNWLNDAAKSCPDWVLEVCNRWEAESPTKQTAYIIKRAKRSLVR